MRSKPWMGAVAGLILSPQYSVPPCPVLSLLALRFGLVPCGGDTATGCLAVGEGPPVAALTLGRHLLSGPGALWAPLSHPKRGQSISEHMLFSEGEAEWGLGNPPSAVVRMGQEKGQWGDPCPPWEYAAQKCAREDSRFSLMCSVQEEFPFVYLRASGGEQGRPWAAWATSGGFSRPTFPLTRAVPGWLPDHSTFPQGYRACGHRSGADLSSRWSWGLPEGGGSREDDDRTSLALMTLPRPCERIRQKLFKITH